MGGDPQDLVDEQTLTATSPPTAAAPSNPRLVGRYQLRDAIGAGGMGIVYRAFDPELGRDVAIKVVRNPGSAAGQARLLREAQAMAQLRHPNVVAVFDVGSIEDGTFIAMPLLEGGTLKRWLAAQKREWPEILDRFLAAGRGLAAAHCCRARLTLAA